jgi:hypothetical protein
MPKSKGKSERKIKPFFGSGVLADSFRSGESGKINISGIFTILYAWSFPCTRTLNAILTIFNLPKGETSIAVSVSKRNSRKLKSLGLFDVSSDVTKGNITVPYIIKYRFEKEGFHEIIFSFRDYPKKLRIPLDIHKKEWPEFTEEELDFVKSMGEKFPAFRITIHCSGCEHVYIFEEQLNPDIPPKGGVYRFPDDSIFICEECDKEMDLRDIRGQLRSSLKDTITQRMGGNL